jgi:hypothetical protein
MASASRISPLRLSGFISFAAASIRASSLGFE